ncbi:FtsK/SpoIIIE family DNA translocase [Candidatus Contubernalis alkaliaceticus]|uniref:FtsK/SpoIIIE family DNA translocase n=1 Tax=Candidatus Contubernalis alkaliaceticus TaxID=338645 RepID=UPI001F4C314E|nr:DNA translocase FtsK [Candidatus Contubernalis alkalaceticus]UNC91861.1 DNA translocase FtsK 4TM domain-containing protein [Candidatus Contubernalis alkalaceticus]
MFGLFNELKEDFRFQLRGLFLLAAGLISFAGLRFTHQTGTIGEVLSSFLHFVAGDLAFVIPFMVCLLGLKNIIPNKIKSCRTRLAGVVILLLLLLVTVHLNLMVEAPLEGMSIFEASYRMGIQRQGGGLIGALLAIVLFYFFGEIGSYIVVSTLGIIAFLLIINISLTQLFAMLGKNMNGLSPKIKPFFLDLYHILFTEEVEEQSEVTVSEGSMFSQSQSLPEYPVHDMEPAVALKPYSTEECYQEEIEDGGFVPEGEEIKNRSGKEEDKVNRQKTGQLTVVVNNEEILSYKLPELSLLPQRTTVKDKQQNKLALERGKVLENTLKNFGVKVNDIQVHSGPTVTRYELQPAKGVKVSHIVSLADDLALSMAAPGVRIEAPIPGKAAVGIEVPNQIISPVYLRHVLESPVFMESRSPLSIGLGNDIYGNPVVADLSKMPHLLIAGATGSGKSVCLSAIIVSILFKANPEEVKFLMIDPKYVELNTYNGIPHLLSPVISDKKKASVALKKMVKEMEERYERFAREGVRDIVSYNDLVRQQGVSYNVLPYIIVVIDELADIMMVAPHDVEDAIARLAQMARAAGIHLVIATQRPSVNVITGVIKANITTRIAFAVSSNADSRVILDMGGAEKLIGQGDMLYHPVGILKPKRIQGAFISEKDVKRIVDFIKGQGIVVIDQKIMNESEEQAGEPEELDEVFPDALKEVVQSGQASISFLQRKFRIGHVRAGRLIDEMERRGIVSGYEGSKARRVLITLEQLPAYLKDLS